MAMNQHQRLADGAARELRWAELNEDWPLMEHLLGILALMGGRVIRIKDPSYNWRSDYLVQFTKKSTAPLALPSPAHP